MGNHPVLLQVMTSKTTVAEGKKVYEMIRPTLELKFPNQFVTIEPVSKEYFIDPKIGQSLAKAQSRYPGRESYTTQIGKDAAMSMKR